MQIKTRSKGSGLFCLFEIDDADFVLVVAPLVADVSSSVGDLESLHDVCAGETLHSATPEICDFDGISATLYLVASCTGHNFAVNVY